MKDNLPDRPGVIAPPPLIYLLPFGAGLWLQHRLPLELGEWAPWLGWPLVAAGVLGFILALMALGRAGTSVNPYKASSAVAATGVYRFTRNPIYLGFAITFAGLAVAMDRVLILLLLIPCLFVIDRFVIQLEERYLSPAALAKYGRK